MTGDMGRISDWHIQHHCLNLNNWN
jgi:hypothetical protein